MRKMLFLSALCVKKMNIVLKIPISVFYHNQESTTYFN